MRRALMVLIAVSTLAACADNPTFSPAASRGWESPRSFVVKAGTGGGGSTVPPTSQPDNGQQNP